MALLRGFAAAFAGLLALAMPASAFEVQESVLQVSYKHNGVPYVFEDTIVPLLPGNACYTWFVRLSETNTAITASERMTLPAAIDWGTVATDPNDGIDVLEGGTVAQSTIATTTDGDGWLTHGWCAAAGDPTGHHSIEVSAEGQELARFEFDVVDPQNYSFPTPPSGAWATRSGDHVW